MSSLRVDLLLELLACRLGVFLAFFHSRVHRLVGFGEVCGELILGGANLLFHFQVLVFRRVAVGSSEPPVGAAMVMEGSLTGT